MTRVTVASQAPTIIEINDELPEFDISRDDESGDVKLTISAEAHDQITINVGRFYDSAESLISALRDVAKEGQSDILDDWQDTPDETDGWVTEGRSNGYYLSLEGQAVGDLKHGYASKDIAVYELAKAMADSGCFPNAWYQNERGNTDSINDEIRKYHDAGGDKLLPLEGVEYEEGDRVTWNHDQWAIVKDYGQLGIVLVHPYEPTYRALAMYRGEVTRDEEDED